MSDKPGVVYVTEDLRERTMHVRFEPPDAREILVSVPLLREILTDAAQHRHIAITFGGPDAQPLPPR